MAEKKKIAELDKAIESTRAELSAIRQEKQAAEDDPERLVLKEKRERRAAQTLEALERAKAAAEYRPPEPTDCAELLLVLQDYRDAKAEKQAAVAASIQAAQQEERETALAFQHAVDTCDTEQAVQLAEKRSELQSKLLHLAEMQERVNATPTFPEGAFRDIWAAICERALPDWKKQVLQVETLAEEYTAACAALLSMHDTLKAARREIERIAEAEGYAPPVFEPVFTVGLDSKALMVEKNSCAWLGNIGRPITGRAL